MRNRERPREGQWSANLAAHLATFVDSGHGAAVTWFNHASLGRSLDAGIDPAEFDYIGIDGWWLRSLVARHAPRTSADLVIPLLLNEVPTGCRIAVVSTTPANVAKVSAAIAELPSAPDVVLSCDGYEGLLPSDELAERLSVLEAQIIIVGLGAPLQDSYVAALSSRVPGSLVLTCGGWLDQYVNPTYYPRAAYRLKLNWLVRLVREPSRLWRRYTVEAISAHRRRDAFREYMLERGRRGFDSMVEACRHPASGSSDVASPPSPSPVA